MQNINFHPAPPLYPGRGGASLAIYSKDKWYGATVHRMTEKVDAGEIYLTGRFLICPTDTCETLYARAEIECFLLLKKFISAENFPKVSRKYRWLRSALTRKQFQEWLVIKNPLSNELERKIKAASHSMFRGPYIKIGSNLFSWEKKII